MPDTQNHHYKNQNLWTYCRNSGSGNLQPRERSDAKDQQRIQDHISCKPDKVCKQGSAGISLCSRESCQRQIQIRKKDQSTGDQCIRSGSSISFCVGQIKKSQQRLYENNTDSSKQNAGQCSELQRTGGIGTCLVIIFAPACLSCIYLSAHSWQGCKPLGEPDIHSAYSHACNRLRTKQSDPCHIHDTVCCSQHGRNHDRQSQLCQSFQDRTGSQIHSFWFTHL